jgi:hypothetical protein
MAFLYIKRKEFFMKTRRTILCSIFAVLISLALGMTVVGCDDGSDGGGGGSGSGGNKGGNGGGGNNDGSDSGDNGGTFTLTGIPAEYNGKYVFLEGEGEGEEDLFLFGAQSIDAEYTITGVVIANGSVSLPMWILSGTQESPTVARYSGNDTDVVVVVSIITSTTASGSRDERENSEAGKTFSSIVFSNGSATKPWNEGTDIDLDQE